MFYKILTFVLILFITILAIYSIHTNQLPHTDNYQNLFDSIYNDIENDVEDNSQEHNYFNEFNKPVQSNNTMRPILESFETTTMQDKIINNWNVAKQHLTKATTYNTHARNLSKNQRKWMATNKRKINNAFDKIQFGRLDQQQRTGDRNIHNLNQDLTILENEKKMNA